MEQILFYLRTTIAGVMGARYIKRNLGFRISGDCFIYIWKTLKKVLRPYFINIGLVFME